MRPCTRRVSEPRPSSSNSTNGRGPRAAVSSDRGQPSRAAHRDVARSFLEQTDRLIADGEALVATPHWDLFRAWLLNSDELLERVWGRMDRYH